MEKITISIAGFNLLLNFYPVQDYAQSKKIFKKTLLHCLNGFIIPNTDQQVYITFNIQDTATYEIIYSKKKSFVEIAEFDKNNVVNLHYQLSVPQFLLILANLLSSLLQHHDGFILHGSAALRNNKADIYIGQSGSGKSTIIKLLKNEFPSIADDQIYIRKRQGVFMLYQTPYMENAPWIQKTHKPFTIGKIYLLHQDTMTIVKKISEQEATPILLENLILTEKDNKLSVKNVFHFSTVTKNFYTLHFNLKRQQLIDSLHMNEQ